MNQVEICVLNLENKSDLRTQTFDENEELWEQVFVTAKKYKGKYLFYVRLENVFRPFLRFDLNGSEEKEMKITNGQLAQLIFVRLGTVSPIARGVFDHKDPTDYTRVSGWVKLDNEVYYLTYRDITWGVTIEVRMVSEKPIQPHLKFQLNTADDDIQIDVTEDFSQLEPKHWLLRAVLNGEWSEKVPVTYDDD